MSARPRPRDNPLGFIIIFAIVLLVFALSACGANSAGPSPGNPPLPPPAVASATAGVAVGTEAPSYGTQPPNERGNIPKEIGQLAATSRVPGDPATALLEFRVDAIEQGAKCAAEYGGEGPTNGQFLAIDLTAKTTTLFDATQDDSWFLTSGWSVVTADGMRHPASTIEASICSPRSAQNLQGLTKGVSAQGTVYVDAPADLTGALLVLNASTWSGGGWEWKIA